VSNLMPLRRRRPGGTKQRRPSRSGLKTVAWPLSQVSLFSGDYPQYRARDRRPGRH